MVKVNPSEISLVQIEAFLSVAETGNMTRSADKLHISQSAISRRVSAMEEQCGMLLFFRSSRNLTLTPAGKTLYSQLKASYDIMNQAFSDAMAVQEARRKVLNISLPYQFSVRILMRVLEVYREKHPDVAVNLVFYPISSAPPPLLAGTLDIALCYKSAIQKEPSLKFHHLVDWQYYALFHKDSALGKKQDLSLEDILNEPQFTFDLQAAYVEELADFYRSNEKTIKVLYRTDNAPLIYSLLKDKVMIIGSPSFCDIWGDRQYIRSQVRGFRLDNFSMDLGLAWSSDREDRYILSFIKSVEQVLDEGDNRRAFSKIINGEPLEG